MNWSDATYFNIKVGDQIDLFKSNGQIAYWSNDSVQKKMLSVIFSDPITLEVLDVASKTSFDSSLDERYVKFKVLGRKEFPNTLKFGMVSKGEEIFIPFYQIGLNKTYYETTNSNPYTDAIKNFITPDKLPSDVSSLIGKILVIPFGTEIEFLQDTNKVFFNYVKQPNGAIAGFESKFDSDYFTQDDFTNTFPINNLYLSSKIGFSKYKSFIIVENIPSEDIPYNTQYNSFVRLKSLPSNAANDDSWHLLPDNVVNNYILNYPSLNEVSTIVAPEKKNNYSQFFQPKNIAIAGLITAGVIGLYYILKSKTNEN